MSQDGSYVYLDIEVGDQLVKDGKSLVRILRKDWGNVIYNKVFTDGITNRLVGFFQPSDPLDIVLVKVYGANTEILINRNEEIYWIQKEKLAPLLYAHFRNGFIYKYFHGATLTTSTCRNPEVVDLLTACLARLHRIESRDEKIPCIWRTLNILMDFISAHSEDQIAGVPPEVFTVKKLQREHQFLFEHLRNSSSPIVLCHNDLLLANIIYNKEKQSLVFIDLEYMGWNYQAYDIANHFCEYPGVSDNYLDYSLYPSLDFQKDWITKYLFEYCDHIFHEQDVQLLLHEVRKFTAAAHFLWALWAVFQSIESKITFDFTKFAEYEKWKVFLKP